MWAGSGDNAPPAEPLVGIGIKIAVDPRRSQSEEPLVDYLLTIILDSRPKPGYLEPETHILKVPASTNQVTNP